MIAPADSESSSELDEIRESIARLQDGVALHSRWLEDASRDLQLHSRWLEDASRDLQAHARWLEDLARAVSTSHSDHTRLDRLDEVLTAAAAKTDRVAEQSLAAARQSQIWAVRGLLEASSTEYDTLISVVLPTRNRSQLLPEAIDSVLQQRHRRFELLVIDDGSEDDTPQLLASIDDPRVRIFTIDHAGHSHARNVGLATATGSVVTFLDDDNLMDRSWLYAVAWGFDRWADADVLYGARLVEDNDAVAGRPSGDVPKVQWEPFDRARLEVHNFVDGHVLALRAAVARRIRFDESLSSCVDWQLALDVTGTKPPFELPAIACVYRSYAPNRVADTVTRAEDLRRVRARAHRSRALRVVSHNAMFPVMSETYILEEMLALEANGARVEFNSVQRATSGIELDRVVTHDLAAATHSFRPDVIFVYWTDHAHAQLAALEAVGVPFALRVHSFDFDVDSVRAIQSHPLCVGVWAYPHHARAIDGAHALVPLFTSHDSIRSCDTARTVALSTSAGLPKKNWPMLFDAMDNIDALEKHIVLAATNGYEDLPASVRLEARRRRGHPQVHVNMPRSEVFDLLARTSVLLYMLDPAATVGMPMSIIEGLRAGACVVHPDRPEFAEVVGPSFRGYHGVDDIVEHVDQIVAGGPQIDAERRTNRDWAIASFCDPALGRQFQDELSSALEAWRYAVT